jgi:beta-lactamase class A
MKADVTAIANQSGARVGIALIDIGGPEAQSWSLNGDMIFTAASTYKFVGLAMEGERISGGSINDAHAICYQYGDYEPGWYDDYWSGRCFTLAQLASRIGDKSDNTSAHMVYRDLGGASAVNAWARSKGAPYAEFSASGNCATGNCATATGEAAIWAAVARGQCGSATQAWLQGFLTHTRYESGIPAGIPGDKTVIHKVGWIYGFHNDAALVTNGPHGPYALVVMTENGDWGLISRISARIYDYEENGRETPEQRRHERMMV